MLAGRGGFLIAVLATVVAALVSAGAPTTVSGASPVAAGPDGGVRAIPAAPVASPLVPGSLLDEPAPSRAVAVTLPRAVKGGSRRTGAAGPAPALQAPVVPTTVPCAPASLEERAARVLIVGLPNVMAPDDPLVTELLDVGVGGVLLTNANVESRDQVTALVSALRTGAKGPLLVSADEEPGRVRTFEDVFGFVPSARRLAAEDSVPAVQDVARTSGADLASVGVNVALAPVADVDAGPSDGIIGDRSFSADPDESSRYALAYARGLAQAGVTPVVKHFPGHGRATEDDHVSFPAVSASLDDLMGTDVRPFADAIAAGAPVVMMSNVAYDALEPGVPASMSPAAYTLLRRLGFTGAAITDSVGMGAVNLLWDFDEAVVKAISAGADGVLATDGWQARRMRDALVAAVQSGRLSEARLNEAAGRMTTLAGGDARRFSCRPADLPVLH